MNWNKEDGEIRRLFRRLRREEEKGAPTFGEVIEGGPRPGPLRVWPQARDWAVVMALLVCSAGLLLNLGSGNWFESELAVVVVPEWQSPTDFLLFSAEERLLVTVPELETGNLWDVDEMGDR